MTLGMTLGQAVLATRTACPTLTRSCGVPSAATDERLLQTCRSAAGPQTHLPLGIASTTATTWGWRSSAALRIQHGPTIQTAQVTIRTAPCTSSTSTPRQCARDSTAGIQQAHIAPHGQDRGR